MKLRSVPVRSQREFCTVDLNSDGRPDIAVANKDDGTISVLVSLADGSFAPPKPYSVGQGPMAITAADFNGDGIPGLAVVNSGDNTFLFCWALQTERSKVRNLTVQALNLLELSPRTSMAISGSTLQSSIRPSQFFLARATERLDRQRRSASPDRQSQL